MNIFVLDEDPKKAAEYHCNKHVVKMILECGQMLCAAHWMHLFKTHYKGTIDDFNRVRDIQQWLFDNTSPDHQPPWRLSHMRHPCTLWTNDSLSNYRCTELGPRVTGGRLVLAHCALTRLSQVQTLALVSIQKMGVPTYLGMTIQVL